MNKQQCIDDAIFHQGFYIKDDFLGEQHHKNLRLAIQTLHDQGLFKSANIGRALNAMHNKAHRTDAIYWLDKHTATDAMNAYFHAIDLLAKTLNQSLFLGLMDFETHFSIYSPGNFYKKHVDQFLTTQDRRISCVYYLNDEWHPNDGGELKLYDHQDRLIKTVLPHKNRFICFNSTIPHEVCVTHKMRYSITGWLKSRSTEQVLFF